MAQDYTKQIQSIYKRQFGRQADPEGLEFWKGQAAQDPNIAKNLSRYITGGAQSIDRDYMRQIKPASIAPATYTPKYKYKTVKDPASVQKGALGTAQDILKQTVSQTRKYPGDITGQMRGPATGEYYQHQAYTPFQRVEGLMGGDYERLEQALQAPILSQAEKQQAQIGDIYSGRGLYGSAGGGMMSAAQAASQEATQNALANAMIQRFGLQMKDIEGRRAQEQAAFAAQAAAADELNRYRQGLMGFDIGQRQRQADFANQLLAQRQQHDLNRALWEQGQAQTDFERSLALEGLGYQGTGMQAQQDIARRQAEAAETGALYGGIGSAIGGLMSSYDSSGESGWNVGSTADWLSGLFK